MFQLQLAAKAEIGINIGYWPLLLQTLPDWHANVLIHLALIRVLQVQSLIRVTT